MISIQRIALAIVALALSVACSREQPATTDGGGAPADDPWGSAPPAGSGGGFSDEPPF